MRNDVIEHIGSCIWEARRHKGYSRRVLSEKTGLSERTIEKIEKGKVNTTTETLLYSYQCFGYVSRLPFQDG